jgi:hypothetical protein
MLHNHALEKSPLHNSRCLLFAANVESVRDPNSSWADFSVEKYTKHLEADAQCLVMTQFVLCGQFTRVIHVMYAACDLLDAALSGRRLQDSAHATCKHLQG